MSLFKHLSFVSAAAMLGFLCVQPPAIAAQAISIPTVHSSASTAVVPTGYYYYHGRRYPYRYHGMYFNHRYYGNGRYHYY